jgi:sulfhydrogenase subunit beta (sulfur reductase)
MEGQIAARNGILSAVRLDPRQGLHALVTVLAADGFRVVGPVVRGAVIAYDDIVAGDDLPTGWAVEQAPGQWRMQQTDDGTRFGYTPGAASWKQYVFPPRQEVLRVRRADDSFVMSHPVPPDRPLALIGARDCEVRALDVLDRVQLDPDHPDPRYAARRRGTFVVAVTCGVPSATCWCTSMGGGPEPRHGFDVRLTELNDGDGHRLLAEAATERGAALLARLPGDDPATVDRPAADAVAAAATAQMPPRLPGKELPNLLAGTEHHPQWDDVAARCLACSNCTMVCPTCFCSAFADVTDLDPDVTVRTQEWASCFQLDHSNLGGRPVRATVASRYRQWLTHKLETWTDQFGTTGCVGCGRCTTWCPAGIDIVSEAAALIASADGNGSG